MAIFYALMGPENIRSIKKKEALKNSVVPSSDIAKCFHPKPRTMHQAFVLKLDLPHAQYFKLKEFSITFIQATWIQSATVYSLQASKLLTNLFAGSLHFKITIDPSIFPEVDPPAHAPDLSSNIKEGVVTDSKMKVLVNTVNCVGIMGKGVALRFKHQFPKMFEDYKKKCSRKQVKIGEPYLWKPEEHLLNEASKWVINFPTKQHWRNNSRIEDIESGLQYLSKHLKIWDVTSLAMPALGCNNGRLKFSDVLPLIQKYLLPLGIQLEIYKPLDVESNSIHKRPPSSLKKYLNQQRPIKKTKSVTSSGMFHTQEKHDKKEAPHKPQTNTLKS